MVYRLPCRHVQYAHAKGRNGWFVPRVVEFEFSEHEDGTPLITLHVFSRRESALSPIELTLALGEWETHVLTIQLRANEERRKGLGAKTKAGPQAG